MTTEEKDKERAWKDYTTKGNDFSTWFTAIIISNFVYLNSIKTPERTRLWWISFVVAIPTFVLIFLFKSLGVLAAKWRVKAQDIGLPEDEKKWLEKWQEKIERARAAFSEIFVILGIVIVVFSGWILIGRVAIGK